jgi:hypothetical protein
VAATALDSIDSIHADQGIRVMHGCPALGRGFQPFCRQECSPPELDEIKCGLTPRNVRDLDSRLPTRIDHSTIGAWAWAWVKRDVAA